jgi:hypothetical protein
VQRFYFKNSFVPHHKPMSGKPTFQQATIFISPQQMVAGKMPLKPEPRKDCPFPPHVTHQFAGKIASMAQREDAWRKHQDMKKSLAKAHALNMTRISPGASPSVVGPAVTSESKKSSDRAWW